MIFIFLKIKIIFICNILFLITLYIYIIILKILLKNSCLVGLEAGATGRVRCDVGGWGGAEVSRLGGRGAVRSNL